MLTMLSCQQLSNGMDRATLHVSGGYNNPYSATSRCLAVLEILSRIVAQCDNSTLYSLALTCKDMSDLALDILWQEVESPFYLFECLPRDKASVSIRLSPRSSDQQALSRILSIRITCRSERKTGTVSHSILAESEV